MKKHLSPSRRRALRPFFVQSQVVVQTMPAPKPAAGAVGRLVIAQSERYCREMSCACIAWHDVLGDDEILNAPAGLSARQENKPKPLFSF